MATINFGSNNLVTTGNINGANITANTYLVGNGYFVTAVRGQNVTGTVPNASTAGTVLANFQPNINVVGNLLSVNVAANGNLTMSGSNSQIVGANLISGNFIQGNGSRLRALNGANVTGQVQSAVYANFANSILLSNVINAGNIASLNLTGNSAQVLYGNGTWTSVSSLTTYGNSNVTTLLSNFGSNIITTTGAITAGVLFGNGNGISNINGSNVFGSVPNAQYALQSGQAENVNVSGVIGIGNLATINADGNASNVLYGNGVFATAPSGTNYGNSNVVSLLANLGSNNITTTGTVSAGLIQANGRLLTGMNGANIVGTVANASFATQSGTAQSVTVANVVGIGNIAIINRDGNASNVLYGNGVFAAAPNGTNYGDSNVTSLLANLGSNNISSNGNIVAARFSGNGRQLFSINAANITGTIANANFAAQAGSAQAVSVGNVLGIGNIATINSDGNASNVLYGNGVFATLPSSTYGNSNVVTLLANLGSNSILTAGTVTAGALAGNARQLFSMNGANVTGTVANSNYAVTAGSAQAVNVGNVLGIGNIATINRDGNASNVLYGNGIFAAIPSTTYGNSNVVTLLANLGSNSITTTGNVDAGFILANGRFLRSLNGANVTGTVANSTYSVTAGLAQTVSVSGVVGIGNVAVLNRDGNSSNVLYGNGVFAAAPNVTFAYGNSNVANFLANYGANTLTTTGNIRVGNLTVGLGNIGNVGAGNYFGNGFYLSRTNGANVLGAVAFANVANSVSVANVSGIGNIATINRDGNASNVLYGNGVFAAKPETAAIGANALLLYNNQGNATGIPNVSYDSSSNILTLGNVDNVAIYGGVAGYVLETDGAGGLSWVPQTSSNAGTLIYTVLDITKADIANVTTTSNHTFVNGSQVVFTGADGSSDWANINNILYYVGNVTANTFEVYLDGNLSNGLNTNAFSNTYTANSANVIQNIGAEPAGANTEVQYNNAGQFGASSKLKFNSVSGNLSVAGNVIAANSVRVLGFGGNITGAYDITAFNNLIGANAIVGNVTANFVSVANTVTAGGLETDQISFSNTGPVIISSGNDIDFEANGQINFNNPIGLGIKTSEELANLSVAIGSMAYDSNLQGPVYYGGNSWIALSSGGGNGGADIVANSVTTSTLTFSGIGPVIVTSGSDLTFNPAGAVKFQSVAQMASLTKAQLANISAPVGSIAYCTDTVDGARPVYYNGTNWVKFSDNGVI